MCLLITNRLVYQGTSNAVATPALPICCHHHCLPRASVPPALSTWLYPFQVSSLSSVHHPVLSRQNKTIPRAMLNPGVECSHSVLLVIVKSLTYLSEEFMSRVSSFWISVSEVV